MFWLRQEIARYAKDLVAKGELASSDADRLDSIPADRAIKWIAHEKDPKPLAQLLAEQLGRRGRGKKRAPTKRTTDGRPPQEKKKTRRKKNVAAPGKSQTNPKRP